MLNSMTPSPQSKPKMLKRLRWQFLTVSSTSRARAKYNERACFARVSVSIIASMLITYDNKKHKKDILEKTSRTELKTVSGKRAKNKLIHADNLSALKTLLDDY